MASSSHPLVPVLAALAQPTRLRILEIVAQADAEGVTAGALATSTQTPPSTLSFHLKEMTQAGLLKARSHGRFIYYSARLDALNDLAEFVGRCTAASSTAKAGGPSRSAKRKKAPEAAKPKDESQLSIFGE